MKEQHPTPNELTAESAAYWRLKLNAYMHDNPGKAFDIKDHEERARELRKVDNFDESEAFDKRADFRAAAADRLPFPHAGKMRVDFRRGQAAFIHPLCDDDTAQQRLGSLTADWIDEITQDNRPVLEEGDARASFIARWRFWRAWCMEHHPQLAYLPADTRIPDHTIWNHLGVVSAFQGCIQRDPAGAGALLLFSFGPVQSFIAAARNIRDLWSGSYLLSYLCSKGLRVIAEELGPDHLLFPSVWNLPLMDLQLRDIYQQCRIRADSDKTLWDQLWQDSPRRRQAYLLPSLPNRFLAIVPASEASALAGRVEGAVRSALKTIADAVSTHLDMKGRRTAPAEMDFERFDRQVADFLEIQWHVQPIPGSVEAVVELARPWLPDNAADGVHPTLATIARLQAAWNAFPHGDRTSYGMLNPTVAWPALTALNAWGLDAIKNSRLFAAWDQQSSWAFGKAENKDSLTGREEAVMMAPATEAAAQKLSKELSGSNPNLLRANERMGAMTLIKRFWHIAYLSNPKYHAFKIGDFRMPDLYALSAGEPFQRALRDEDDSSEADCDDERPEDTIGTDDDRHYYAVLALDGDEMGKWISGEKLPSVRSRLPQEARKYFNEDLREVPGQASIQEFLDKNRPLNPSFHLQFSEALGNFGQFAVRRIVEAFNGRLIYAGGDDVLALLSARGALPCAQALRAAFRGDYDGLKGITGAWKGPQRIEVEGGLFAPAPLGFIRLNKDLRSMGLAMPHEPLTWDALVPGPAADVSVGIAIGHYKSPLQDLVRAAQRAEKRAKQELGRSAVAVDIIKRSGEQVAWGTRWGNGHALRLLGQLLGNGLGERGLSARFPYKLIQLLEPYLPVEGAGTGLAALEPAFAADLGAIVRMEFAHVLAREENRQRPKNNQSGTLPEAFDAYWQELETQCPEPLARLRHLIGLLQTMAWIQKDRAASDNL